MKSDDTPMYDDPSESAFVRDLLQAGRRANVEYDVERGLAKHLATISAGGTAPYWLAGATAAKRSVPLWVGYVTVPLVAAGVAGLLWVFSARPESTGATPNGAPQSESIAPAPAAGLDRASDSLEDEAAADIPHDLARAGERRTARPSARPSISPAPGRTVRSGSTSRGPSESPAIAVGEGSASATARSGSSDAVAANPYASSASASGSTIDPPGPGSIQSNAAPRAPEPAAPPAEAETEAEPTAEEAAAAPPAKQRPAEHRPIVDESRLEREMQMLAVTQRVLTSDPERALRLAQQGEREFPGTMFSAERRQLGLLALVKLGRIEEARREGKSFLARYPKAPWSERLRRALATGVVE